jgi:hypothetical protein
MYSSAPIHLAHEQTGRNNKQTKYTDRGSHSGYECSRFLIQLKHVAYKVGTSRYQVHARRHQTQRSLKVASLRDPVRIAHPAIASVGSAQTQCPTPRRIQNTLGPWMRVHPLGTLAAEIGLPILPLPTLFVRR